MNSERVSSTEVRQAERDFQDASVQFEHAMDELKVHLVNDRRSLEGGRETVRSWIDEFADNAIRGIRVKAEDQLRLMDEHKILAWGVVLAAGFLIGIAVGGSQRIAESERQGGWDHGQDPEELAMLKEWNTEAPPKVQSG